MTITNISSESRIILNQSDRHNTLKILASKRVEIMVHKIKKVHILTTNNRDSKRSDIHSG